MLPWHLTHFAAKIEATGANGPEAEVASSFPLHPTTTTVATAQHNNPIFIGALPSAARAEHLVFYPVLSLDDSRLPAFRDLAPAAAPITTAKRQSAIIRLSRGRPTTMDWTDRIVEHQVFDTRRFLVDEPIVHCRFTKCSFRGARMAEITSQACEFEDCDFTDVAMYSSHHRATAFLNCNLAGARLFGARFEDCRVVGSVFENADLNGVRIERGDWSYVVLRMQNLDGLDLRGVKLEGADLHGCSLVGADLRDAVLKGANLGSAKLTKADLRGADLCGVDLRDLPIKGARMTLDQTVLFAACHGILVE